MRGGNDVPDSYPRNTDGEDLFVGDVGVSSAVSQAQYAEIFEAVVAALAELVSEQPHAADRRGREDAAAVGLVVKRDVTGHDWKIERAAGLRDALQAADELAHDLGALGIAKVEVVRDRQRPSADRGDVAPGFSHGLLASFERIGFAIARRHIDGKREPLGSVLHSYHRGIAAGTLHGVAQDHVIVLLPDPAFRAKLGGRDQLLQRGSNPNRHLHVPRMDYRQRRQRHVRAIV